MKPLDRVLLSLTLFLALCDAAIAAEPEATADRAQASSAAASHESGQSAKPLRRLEEMARQSLGNPALRRDVEAELLKLLAPAATFEAKKFACVQLGIIGSQAALPELSKLLAEPETASIGCLALSTYPRGRADQTLRAALIFANGMARIQIINTLGDRRDPGAVAQLSKSATDPDKAVAEAAITALGKIGSPAAYKAIAALRGNTDLALSAALAEATLRAADRLVTSGDLKQAKTLYQALLKDSGIPAVQRSSLAVLLTLDKDGGEERIVDTLASTNSFLKPVAIAAMSRVHSPGASEKFAAQINHLKPEEQALLIESLGFRDDNSARLALAKALSSPEPLTRRAAVVALGRLGDPYFASLLARSAALATDADENRAIESALAGLKGDAETDKRLIAEMKTSLPKARVQLIGALERRQGAAANPVLLEEAENSDPAVAKAAFRALAKSGTAADAAPLLTKLAGVRDAGVRSEAESTVAQVLARIDDPSRRSALVREALAKTTTAESKVSLLGLLPACADWEALSTLTTAAADPESQIRDAAVRALAEWPDAAAYDALLALYRQPGAGSLHGMALRGLVRLVAEENSDPGVKVIEHYRALIAGARGASDLKLILGTLGGYSQPEALPLALPFLSDPAVRAEAIVAVRRIAEACKVQNPQLAEEALKRLPNP